MKTDGRVTHEIWGRSYMRSDGWLIQTNLMGLCVFGMGVYTKSDIRLYFNFPIYKVSFAEVRCMYQNSVLCSQINQMF